MTATSFLTFLDIFFVIFLTCKKEFFLEFKILKKKIFLVNFPIQLFRFWNASSVSSSSFISDFTNSPVKQEIFQLNSCNFHLYKKKLFYWEFFASEKITQLNLIFPQNPFPSSFQTKLKKIIPPFPYLPHTEFNHQKPQGKIGIFEVIKLIF